MWAGVPEWRLPRDVIMEEVEQILDLGIEIRYNTEIGKDIPFKDLVDNYDAVLISAGCQIAQEIGIPGEDLNGVVSGSAVPGGCESRHRRMSGSASTSSPSVVVSPRWTACAPCCAWAPRRSIMTYRRSIQEIPVEELELEEAEIEGVEIMYMVAPTGSSATPMARSSGSR